MKTKQNLKYVTFICDNCKEISDKRIELDSSNFTGENPFPYKENWVYIYNMQFKILGKSVVLKDKHFCNRGCIIEYIDSQINKVYETRVELK